MSCYCLLVAFVLTNGVSSREQSCRGTIRVIEPVLENRPVTVTFTSTRLQEFDARWTINEDNTWYSQETYSHMFQKSFQNSSIATVTVTNISLWKSPTLRVKLLDNKGATQCYQDQRITLTNLGECGTLNASSNYIRQGRAVELEYFTHARREMQELLHHSYILLFLDDADDQFISIKNFSYPEDIDQESLQFKYTLRSPRSDGIYLVVCDAEERKYSTSVRLKIAVTPSSPILQNLQNERYGCKVCIYVSESEYIWIKCNVSGGTGPKNVTISVGIHTSQTSFENGVYMSSFKKAQLTHGSNVTCNVLNPALDYPLNATARLYIEKRPNNTEIKLNAIATGKIGTVKCVSTGMRPARNLTLDVEGAACNTTQNVSVNNEVDTYNVTVTCSFTANKTLHKKPVKCCWDKTCQTKQMNIQFPPDNVVANQSVLKDKKMSNSTSLSCYVSRSNPPCEVRWEIPAEVTDYRAENFSNTLGQNEGLNKLSRIFLNVSRLDHGRQIQCFALCGQFEVRSDIVSLTVPGAPLMQVFPGNSVTKREGEPLTLDCTVDSIPKSKISWYHGNDILSESGSARCDNYSKCHHSYDFGNLVEAQSGNYTCIADNDHFEQRKEVVVLKVIDLVPLEGNEETLYKKPWFFPAVAGGGAFMLIALIIAVVFAVWRRKKSQKNSIEPNGHKARQDAGEQIQGEIEEQHGGVIGDGEEAVVENVMYASVKKDNAQQSTSRDQKVSYTDVQESNEFGNAVTVQETVQTDNTYAQVLPRAERQKHTQNVKATTSGEKELVYLDLEFNTASSGSKVSGVHQNDAERTEYVTVDFSRKAPTDS